MLELPRQHFAVILADPPWRFETWSENGNDRAPEYALLDNTSIAALPVRALAAADCVLFIWATWPMLDAALNVINGWGFTFKTCAFLWAKANTQQIDMFRDDADVQVGLGYWTRANTEPCLLATRGKPKRLNADVRQAIIEPRREHSRKPDCVYDRIERLVAGPYLELFARTQRAGWTSWGNEVGKFSSLERGDATSANAEQRNQANSDQLTISMD